MHYYMGNQRIASALISIPWYSEIENPDPVPEPGEPGLESGGGPAAAVQDLDALLNYYGFQEGEVYDWNIYWALQA